MILTFIPPLIGKNSLVLDIGCGNKQNTFSPRTTTVDAWDKVKPDFLIDLESNDLPFGENTFDHVTLLDFIEHLDKAAGKRVLEQAKKIARKSVILLTPLFWDDNSENVENPSLWSYGNPYDYHKSLWSVEDDFTDWKTVTIEQYRKGPVWLGVWEK